MSYAEIKTWNNTLASAGVSWFQAENWDPASVPGAGDDVIIDLDNNVSIDNMPEVDAAGAVANSITIRGNSSETDHGIPAQITVKNGGDLTVGSASTPGYFTLHYTHEDAILIIEDGGIVTVYGSINNTGQILVKGGGSLTQNNGNLFLQLTPYNDNWTTRIEVEANGSLTLNSDLKLEAGEAIVNGSGTFSVENISKTTTETTTIKGDGTLIYSGNITVSEGELEVLGNIAQQ